MQTQGVEGLVKIVTAGQAETVYGTWAILAQEHLVEIGLENLILIDMQLQQHCHPHFRQLAQEAPLLGQVVVLDELLGDGAAALHHPTGAQVDQGRPGHTGEGDAPVLVEVAILDRQQGCHQLRGGVIEPGQQAVIEIQFVGEAADGNGPLNGQIPISAANVSPEVFPNPIDVSGSAAIVPA